MSHSSHTIHTGSRRASQDLTETAAHHQATVLRLLRRLTEGPCLPDTVHAVRTHCRRLQALLELCGDDERALLMAENVRRLSKLRALQVFRQYLIKIEAPQVDVDAVDAWIAKKEHKLRHGQAYQQIEQAVWKHALPAISHLNHSLKNKLEVLRHRHEKNLACLIEAAVDKPRRKRLHALRLVLKTIRYQTEWLPGRRGPKQTLVKRVKQVQSVLGRYEEMADFRQWGKTLDSTVQKRIQKDWKRARKRARAVPTALTWLMDAIASGQVWMGIDGSATLLGRQSIHSI